MGAEERAARAWCAWEDTRVSTAPGFEPDPRFDDARYRPAFARLVTHSWANTTWLEAGQLLLEAGKLAGIPGELIHGRLDISSPLDVPRRVARACPGCALVVIDEAGHGSGGDTGTALRAATDRFARRV